MIPDPEQAAALFDRAFEFEASERAAFLAGACGNDVNLRRRVEDLLLAHEAKSGFLPKGDSMDADGRGGEWAEPQTLNMGVPLTEGPGTLIDRYKLLEKLGEGGFGAVWAAEQREPVKRRVALKIIKLGMDTGQVVARFEAERQALALMDHPNIAKVLDAGTTDTGRPYFVMELVRGIPITKYCDQEKLDTYARLDLFTKVCNAIQHAHQKGIIHRDIKPSNILVTLHDGVPVPKVIDFGIAKATQQELTEKTIYTQFQQFIGTPAYMSPEQAEMSGLDIDTRSDIYSLGVLLYELLTGTTPFNAKELMSSGLDEMRKIIREREPLRPSSRLTQELTTREEAGSHHSALPAAVRVPHSEIDRDLDWIVLKCLEKDRARRYDTANGLANDLKRHLENEPVVARPPSTAYRLQKVWQRNRFAISAATAVAAALILATGVSLWQAARAHRASAKATVAQAAEQEQRIAAVEAKEAAEGQREVAKRAQAQADAEREVAQRYLYAANMNLLQQAWEQNNLGRVRQLLNATASHQERDFEWYYWQRQTRLALHTLQGHLDRVDAVAFSPLDGRRLVSAGGDQQVKVWDTVSGRELMSLTGHTGLIFSVAFSPDGQRLVTGSWDQTAKVWDMAGGRLIHSLEGHRSAVWSVAFSSNGLIATGSSDQTARIWNASDGQEVLTIADHEEAVSSVDFSPDGTRLLTASRDGKVKIWDARTGEELARIPVRAFSTKAKFSPDGQRIITLLSRGQTATMWNAADGEELFTMKGHGPGGLLLAVAFSPDSSRVVTGSDDNTAKIWDAKDGRELLTLKGHSNSVRGVGFSPDGQRVVTASHDRTLRLWDASPQNDRLATVGHTGPIRSVAFSPDGGRVATGSEDQTAIVWDPRTGRQEFDLPGHKDWISSVAFSPDGQYAATGSEDQTAIVWSAVTGRELHRFSGHTAGVLCVALSPDNGRIVTGSWDHTAIVWEIADEKRWLTLAEHTGPVWSVAFSPDGLWIVTGSEDDTAKVWDVASGRVVRTLVGHNGAVRSAAFSADGRWIVTGSVDGTARVWDADTGKQERIFRGHNGAIWSAAFSQNGQRIVTGGSDRTVRVWDATGGGELLALTGFTGDVLSAAFSPDGLSILGGSADESTRLWEAASLERLAAWQEGERREDERMAVVRREAATKAQAEQDHWSRDPGAVKKWLILAPIRIPTLEALERAAAVKGMEQQHVPIEKHDFLPRHGDRVAVGDRQLVWRAGDFPDHVIPFDEFLGEGTYWPSCLAYAVTYIHSEEQRTGLQARVGWDDYAEVYLNGVRVYQSEQSPWARDAAVVKEGVTLEAGRNILVFKVANGIGPWRGSIRFTDAAGNAVQGIRVTLDPEPSDAS